MSAISTKVKFGPLQIGIVLLAAATAIIHLTLAFPLSLGNVMFILNCLGYLGLTAALFLPLPYAKDHRPLVRYALMGFTALTIILWVAIGMRTAIGYSAKIIEVALIALLWLDRK